MFIFIYAYTYDIRSESCSVVKPQKVPNKKNCEKK